MQWVGIGTHTQNADQMLDTLGNRKWCLSDLESRRDRGLSTTAATTLNIFILSFSLPLAPCRQPEMYTVCHYIKFLEGDLFRKDKSERTGAKISYH